MTLILFARQSDVIALQNGVFNQITVGGTVLYTIQGNIAPIQVNEVTTTDFTPGLFAIGWGNQSGYGGSLTLAHSPSGTVGTQAALQSGYELGTLAFAGSDGTALSYGAYIFAHAGSTWTTSNHETVLDVVLTPSGSTASTSTLRFQSNGGITIGSSAVTLTGPNYNLVEINSIGTTTNTPGLSAIGWGNQSGYGGNLTLAHSPSGVVGTQAALSSGYNEGAIAFGGSDGTAIAFGSFIFATAGSNWTTSNHESYLTFFNTTNGSTTNVEQMRLMSNGILGIGFTADQGGGQLLQVNSGAFFAGTTTQIVNQNGPTTASVNNNSTGTGAIADTLYTNSANSAYFGIGGTGYTTVLPLQNSAFIYASSGAAGIVLANTGAKPITFYNNVSQVGQFSGTTLGLLTLGLAGTNVGELALANATSGTVTIAPPTGALVANVNTLQAVTDTFVYRASTDTLTNKTLASSTDVLGGVTMTLGSDATGDIYYRNAGGVLTRLGIGSTGNVLTVSSGLPAWESATGNFVTSFSAGTTGFTPSTATDGAVTLAGVLIGTNGGTGVNNGASTITVAGNFTVATNGGTLAFSAASKTLTVSNSLTLAGTDATTMTFPATSATVAGLGIAQTWTAAQTHNNGTLLLAGSTSGAMTLEAPAVASSYVITFPAATDTVAVLATAQTLTNKTIAFASNTLTGVAPLASPTFTGTVTFPGSSTATTSGFGSVVALGVGETAPSAGNVNISGTYQVAGSAFAIGNLASIAASSLVGNPTGSSAAPAAITLGSTLNFTTTVLNATTATASQLGVVKPDGTTITVAAGVITAVGASATSIDTGGATTTVSNGTANDILYTTGTSPLYVNKIATANSSVLITNSSGVPSWASILTVPNGGTGVATLTGLLQGNGTGAVTGITGTAGQLPYYNGSNTLAATSVIFISGTNVGINNTSPGVGLDIVGNVHAYIASGNTNVNVDGMATGSPYLGLSQSGTLKAYVQYANSTSTLNFVNTALGIQINSSGYVYMPNLQLATGADFVSWSSGGALTASAIGPSDTRLKKNFGVAPGLKEVLQLEPISYNWRDTKLYPQTRQLGFKGQDVETIIPELVHVRTKKDRPIVITLEDGTTETLYDARQLDYDKFVVPLVNAIKELNAKIEGLEARLAIATARP
jgi:hypothetical protein